MGFNKDKKKKLADLLAKRRAAAAGVGTSTPGDPAPLTTFVPHPNEPTPVDDRQKGVVAVDLDDEETCTGLVFKRQRVGEAIASFPSASGGTPTFRDNPPSASSPCQLVVHEGAGESVPEAQQVPFAPELPMLLQQILKHFQDKEVLESLGGNLFQDHIVHYLGDFLVASNLDLSRAQEAENIKTRMAKLEEELSLKAKTFVNRETALYVELASLCQSEKDTKKALHDKGQEAFRLEAKIFPLRTNVIELEGLVAEMKEKVAKLEDRATQREVLLGQVEGELAEKVESFKKVDDELTNDAADAYGEGFEDAIAQFSYVHPKVDLSPFAESKCVVDRQLVLRE